MRIIFILLSIFLVFVNCSNKTQNINQPEYKTYFDEYEVEGCFLLYDFQKNKTIVYNEERCKKGFLPASTFKIVNTLIGLETEIITGEEFIIPWDSVSRQVPIWNRDHRLKSAFQNSVVPWYQELARQIGTERMQYWVSQSDFGEMDVHDENIDLFWLTGKSRITPTEQLDFQNRMIQNQLPFQQKNIDLVKKIMILEETPEYIFRGKTGWAVMGNKNIGWLVGYLEKDDNKYVYVLNVESEDEDSTLFQKSRIEIVRKIFNQLSLM
jgi:beta-lactamase class D